jgi:hypothetical protein
VYQQQEQEQQEQEQQEQEQDAENPFLDPPFSRIKKREIKIHPAQSAFYAKNVCR